MTVDPGIGGTGIAYWDMISRGRSKPHLPDTVKAITSKEPVWESKVEAITATFSGVLEALKPNWVIIEFQELWAGSASSMASASGGSLFKLTYLTGQFGKAVNDRCPNMAVLIGPSGWKGQLSKKAIDLRIRRAFGKKVKFPNHVSDAVGMGLAIQGVL